VARTTFPVEVLTPEGEVFNDEVEMIATKTVGGSIGILARHQPLLAMLDPAELRLYRSESDVVRLVQGEGYLQVGADGGVLILVDEAVSPEQGRHRRGGGETARRGGGLRESGGPLRGAAPRRPRQAPLGGLPARRRRLLTNR